MHAHIKVSKSYIVVHFFPLSFLILRHHDCLNLKGETSDIEMSWQGKHENVEVIQRKTNSNYTFHDYAKKEYFMWID